MKTLRHLLLAILITLSGACPGQSAAASPTDAYIAYHETLKASYTFDAVMPLYSNARRNLIRTQYPSAMRDTAFSLIKNSSPGRVAIEREVIEGEQAMLSLTGTDDGKHYGGVAKLVLQGGAWRIDEVSWRER